MDEYSTATIFLLFLFIIFLILSLVFIWLYVGQINKSSELQNTIDNNKNCPPEKKCKDCTETSYLPFATTGSRQVISCNNSTINNLEVYEKHKGRIIDVSSYYTDSIGKSTYVLDPKLSNLHSNITYGMVSCANNMDPVIYDDEREEHNTNSYLFESESSKPCNNKKKHHNYY